MPRVSRPTVRSFAWRFRANAASWVRAGGHAVVWVSSKRARLVVRKPRKGDELDLGLWSALDLGRCAFDRPSRGPFAGLAVLRIPSDCFSIVRARALRDSIHEGPTRAMRLDCLSCAACCRANRVVLDDADIARFEGAGRGELARAPYARRHGGELVLVLRRDKSCKHLGVDKRCGIYGLRPSACSTFPVASECCLSSRAEELGVVDGCELGT
ncbi:MAG: YkgJ family cysteine cluster protein [Polyangiaceae bacterium]|jgi:Fe-S-cluster containining protein